MTKKILKSFATTLALSGVALNAYAVAPGFYIGVMGGPVTNSAKQSTVQAPTTDSDTDTNGNEIDNDTSTQSVTFKPKKNQFGARVFMGYKVNPYAAFEMGGSYYSTVRYETTSGQNTCGTPEITIGTIDLLAKGSIPLGSSFEVYGKAGVAGVYEHISGALESAIEVTTTTNGVTTTSTQCAKSTQTTEGRGTASIGVSYDLSQNVVADISYNRLMAGGQVGNLTMYALGISYHFVDKYCGQFLCDD